MWCYFHNLFLDLLAAALTQRSTFARGETIVQNVDVQTATALRDSFVKALYSQMFGWLVTQINDAMALESQLITGTAGNRNSSEAAMASIGVLDIYGFEVLANNSFEQLCINYCNESLHQFFVSVVFKIEQAEYVRLDDVQRSAVCEPRAPVRPCAHAVWMDVCRVLFKELSRSPHALWRESAPLPLSSTVAIIVNADAVCVHECAVSRHNRYEKQAINWHKIKFVDNQATLNLLAVNQMNLFALIDEDSNLGGRQDSELVAKMMACKARDAHLRPVAPEGLSL